MLNIAHRGASGHAPENTMLAFNKALEMGANALEFDVRICASGEAVVIHDETLDRTTNGTGFVFETSLTNLKHLDAGHGESIPLLAEVIRTFASKATLFIEIKDERAIDEVIALIDEQAAQRVPYHQMPLIGFDPNWLIAAKAKQPELLIGATPDDTQPIANGYINWAKQQGFSSVNPHHRWLNAEVMAELRMHGLQTYPWTVNEPNDIAQLKALGVDGIISDYPDRL
ncbi:MAG: glycerophosphodiester phosphodiesterase family protein [Alphaproteobacteria bacterium]|nr:glycerophosphodiester phosphodiesterase family protein [Alphaproteobacteria bacterium]